MEVLHQDQDRLVIGENLRRLNALFLIVIVAFCVGGYFFIPFFGENPLLILIIIAGIVYILFGHLEIIYTFDKKTNILTIDTYKLYGKRSEQVSLAKFEHVKFIPIPRYLIRYQWEAIQLTGIILVDKSGKYIRVLPSAYHFLHLYKNSINSNTIESNLGKIIAEFLGIPYKDKFNTVILK